MLKKWMLHEKERDGTTYITCGPELEDEPCYRCGRESVPNVCSGDGRYHWHGRVHTRDSGLEALCKKCEPIAWQEWNPTLSLSERP